ncbi:unnamed protein product [Gadus morhua 'NCC']
MVLWTTLSCTFLVPIVNSPGDRRCICHQEPELPPGTVRVVRAAEWVIRQASASFRPSQPIKLLEVLYIVRMWIGSEDVLVLREHIGNTQTATTIRC